MSWKIIPLGKSLLTWSTHWDELNKLYYRGHPFNDSRFINALLQHFGSGKEHLCVHYSSGKVDGMLILEPRRFGIWTQFSPAQAQMCSTLINDKNILNTLFNALPWHVCLVELLRQDPSFTPPELVKQDKQIRLLPYALTMNIELKGEFNSYWESRSKNLNKNMRRYSRRAADDFSNIELRTITEPHLIHAAIERYGALESTGWKKNEGTAISIDNVQGIFYSEIMTKLAQTGQAEIVEYWFNEQLAASRLLVSDSDINIILKTTYSETLSEYAPGRLLLKSLIEKAFGDTPNKLLEFYTNATQDQLSWATGQRQMYHVMFFRNQYLASLFDVFNSTKNTLNGKNLAKTIQ